MDGWLIAAIICGVIALIITLVNFGTKKAGPMPKEDDFGTGYDAERRFNKAKANWERMAVAKFGVRVVTAIVWTITGVLFFMSTFIIVPTNTISITSSFGKPQTALQNGWQWKSPVEKATDFDASRQFLRFEGKGNGDAPDSNSKQWPCIQVRMDKEATACISGVVSWQLKASTSAEKRQAVDLFKTYKTFGRLTENFIRQAAWSAAQEAYSDVNPLVPAKNPGINDLNNEWLSLLRVKIGEEVALHSVQITNPDYDSETDKRIAQMQAEFANTELAKQREQTNIAESKANNALVESLDDKVLRKQCIDGAVAKGFNPGACLQPGWGIPGNK